MKQGEDNLLLSWTKISGGRKKARTWTDAWIFNSLYGNGYACDLTSDDKKTQMGHRYSS